LELVLFYAVTFWNMKKALQGGETGMLFSVYRKASCQEQFIICF